MVVVARPDVEVMWRVQHKNRMKHMEKLFIRPNGPPAERERNTVDYPRIVKQYNRKAVSN